MKVIIKLMSKGNCDFVRSDTNNNNNNNNKNNISFIFNQIEVVILSE